MASNFSAVSLLVLFLSFTILSRSTSDAWILGPRQPSEENVVHDTASSSQHNSDHHARQTATHGVFQSMADGFGPYQDGYGPYPGYLPQYPYPSGYYPNYNYPTYPNGGFVPYPPQPTPFYPGGDFSNPGSFGSGFGSAGPYGGTGAGNGGAKGGSSLGGAPGARASFGTGSANTVGGPRGPGASASGNGAGAGIGIDSPQVRPSCPGCV